MGDPSEQESGSRWQDWLFLLGCAFTLAPLVVAFLANSSSGDQGGGLGSLLPLVFGLWASIPLFLIGFAWLACAAVVRPFSRDDAPGWVVRGWLAALSLALLLCAWLLPGSAELLSGLDPVAATALGVVGILCVVAMPAWSLVAR